MKKPIQSLVAIAVFALGTLAAQAQPAIKLLVVDMLKLYDGHYETVEYAAKMKAHRELAEVEVGKMRTEGQKLVEDYKVSAEQANNPILSQDAKAKAQAEAQKKYEALQKAEQELNGFVQDVRQ
ncbi:MAG: OmpH family outer membrane protein, partial [Opitutaceae bacterium]